MKVLFAAAAKVAQIQFASTPRQLIHPPNGVLWQGSTGHGLRVER